MKVPFLDLQPGFQELQGDLEAAALRVMRSGWFILGSELAAFENEWAGYCDARFAVGVSDGLAALTLALRACGVGAGHEVIVPANTFVATWLAVSACGATPVPVDPDPDTANLSVEGIAQGVTPRTRAIVPVHLYGTPCDIEAIVAFARPRGLLVIEDAAQAHGARAGDRRIGAHGDAVCWSFYPGKNLGAMGDAGAVTTDSEDVAEACRLLRNYGSRVKYQHLVAGVNSRLDELQAAILRAKLQRLDAWNARRAERVARYSQRLSRLGFWTPRVPAGVASVHHLLVTVSENREALRAHLGAAGVETLVHYPVPPHMQPAYASLGYAPERYPVSRWLAENLVSLPLGPHLPLEQVDHVCDCLDDAVATGIARPAVFRVSR